MTRSSARRHVLVAGMLAALGALSACGSGGGVVAQGGTGPGGSSPAATAPVGADPGPSPVADVDAGELIAAVTAPVPTQARRSTGPTADRVTLPDGRTVWRVRLPGDAPVRAARATVAIGGTDVGLANPTPSLDALVAITTDGTAVVAGAPVTLTWEGSTPTAVGNLEVLS